LNAVKTEGSSTLIDVSRQQPTDRKGHKMTLEAIDEPGDVAAARPSHGRPRRAAYTVREVAALLGLSPGTTYALVRAGAIPARRMGGRWIVPKQRFDDWLNARSSK
jgi:excisionase family DNA binding protein